MKSNVGASARRCGGTVALVLLSVAATPAVGVDPAGMNTAAVRTEPNLRRGFLPEVAVKIRFGYRLAITRARTIPTCAALFQELGSDPIELLGRSLYCPATLHGGGHLCANGALAFTPIGSPVTWVCDRFKDLSREEAAMVLLHEALHFAGLRERPPDPDAMTASEINGMVEDRCGR